MLTFSLIIISSYLSHSLYPPRLKIGSETRQPKFFLNSFIKKWWIFLILTITTPIDLQFSSSTLMLILYKILFQYPGHKLFNINE